jgi:hypothetical protein
MIKIKLDHSRLDIPAYIARIREIITALTGNANFAAVAGKLPPLTAQVDALEEKYTASDVAAQALKTAMAERDAAWDATESAVRALASSCEGETQDDAALQSGGWHLRSGRVTVGPLPAPQDLSGTAGDQEGEVDLMWTAVVGRDTYIGEQASSATGPWTQCYVGKKSTCTVKGLTSGQLYYFRFRAVGTAGPGPWSDITQCRAS